MENIIKIVLLWTKLPEFSCLGRSQCRKAFSTIGYKSQPLPDPGQHLGKEYPLGWNLCCASKTFVLNVQTGTRWIKPLIFWHKMILTGAEYLTLGLRVNNVMFQLSSIHFDWRAFFMSFTSIYTEGGKSSKHRHYEMAAIREAEIIYVYQCKEETQADHFERWNWQNDNWMKNW